MFLSLDLSPKPIPVNVPPVPIAQVKPLTFPFV
jgi:hypothetical protein